MKEARLSDLQNVAITFHPQEKTFRQKDADPEITNFSDDSYEWLPNTFVWELFAAMIAGIQHMHNAGIVHRDFKPANVFLDIADSEEEEHLRGWKVRPLIADYGSCMPLVPTRYNNPDDFDHTKTEPYNAPEQWIAYPPIIQDPMDPRRAFPMAEPADVLALGMTMWMIIRTATHPGKTVGKVKPPKEKKRATAIKGKKMLYDAAIKTRPDDVVKHIDDFMETWGEAQVGQLALHAHWKAEVPLLLDMIKQCLHWDPSERPTLDVLSEQVKAHLVDPSTSAPAGVERETFFQYLRLSAPTAEDATGDVETPSEDANPEEGVGKGKGRAKRGKRR
jgi:serine/threonine protein kinase